MNNSKEIQSQVYHVANNLYLEILPEEKRKYSENYGSLIIQDDNGQSYGNLNYCWNSKKSYWEIEYISVKRGYKRKGLGRKLLEAFCRKIGPNQRVQATITHEETVSTLINRYANKMLPKESIFISGENIKDIPFVKFCESGGIRVDNIFFTKSPRSKKYFPHSISLLGRTK